MRIFIGNILANRYHIGTESISIVITIVSSNIQSLETIMKLPKIHFSLSTKHVSFEMNEFLANTFYYLWTCDESIFDRDMTHAWNEFKVFSGDPFRKRNLVKITISQSK